MTGSSQGGDQLAREARIALPLLGLLFVVFVFTAYRRMSGWSDAPPTNIQAPAGDSRVADPRDRATPRRSTSGRSTSDPLSGKEVPSQNPAVIPSAEIRRPPGAERLGPGSPANRTQPIRTAPPRSDSPDQSRREEDIPSNWRSSSDGQPPRNSNQEPSDASRRRDQLADTTRTRSSRASGRQASGRRAATDRYPGPGLPGNPAQSYSFSATPSELPRRPATRPPQPNSAPLQEPSSRQPRSSRFTQPDRTPPSIRPEVGRDGLHSPQAPPAVGSALEDGPPRSDGAHEKANHQELTRRVLVVEDDSCWTLAERAYGTGQYFRAVHAWLRKQGMTGELPVGRTLELPDPRLLREQFAGLVPAAEGSQEQVAATGGGTSVPTDSGLSGSPPSTRPTLREDAVVTKGGETLFELAAEHLGQASRYVELAKLNAVRLPPNCRPSDPLPPRLRLKLR